MHVRDPSLSHQSASHLPASHLTGRRASRFGTALAFCALGAGLALAGPVAAQAGANPDAAPPAAPTDFLMWQLPASGVNFPVYVYRDKKQTGYLYGTAQQSFLGGYDATTAGTWSLYYRKGRKWYGCRLVLSAGAIDSKTTCPGAVLNPPVASSNVYTVAFGASTWPASAKPPVTPVDTDYGKRGIVFVNNTQYASIRIGMHCTVSANPSNPACVNKADLLEVKQGQRVVFQVDDRKAEGSAYPAGLISYAFSMTAYQNAQGTWVDSGGYSENQPYATKIELTNLPVRTNAAGQQFPTGATNFDVSAVDGYNVGVKAYPATPAYCTYTVPPENSNVLGAGLYSEKAPLASIDATAQTCRGSSQLPGKTRRGAWNLLVANKAGDFQGCMSPCTYASAKFGSQSAQAARYCCSGAFGTASSCDQPAGKPGANTSTYVQNLGSATKNVYRFAYDDAIGDFACPAQTSFVVEFTTL